MFFWESRESLECDHRLSKDSPLHRKDGTSSFKIYQKQTLWCLLCRACAVEGSRRLLYNTIRTVDHQAI